MDIYTEINLKVEELETLLKSFGIIHEDASLHFQIPTENSVGNLTIASHKTSPLSIYGVGTYFGNTAEEMNSILGDHLRITQFICLRILLEEKRHKLQVEMILDLPKDKFEIFRVLVDDGMDHQSAFIAASRL